MERAVNVKGVRKVKKNLKRAIKETKTNTTGGLATFARKIHRSANSNTPLIPKDTGNLIQSRFVVDDSGSVTFGKKPRFSSKGADGRYHRGRARAAYLDHQKTIHKYLGKAKRSDDPVAYCGYSVDYAIFVHELGLTVRPKAAPINWTRPGSGRHFFTAAINREANKAIKIVEKKANVNNIKFLKNRTKGNVQKFRGFNYAGT